MIRRVMAFGLLLLSRPAYAGGPPAPPGAPKLAPDVLTFVKVRAPVEALTR